MAHPSREPAPGALRVVVVEDDPRLLAILARHLERLGHAVRRAQRAEAALRHLEAAPADVVLTDLRMPGMDGMALLAELRARHPGVRVILMTAFGEAGGAAAAVEAGAHAYVTKPFKVEVLADLLRDIADRPGPGRSGREAAGDDSGAAPAGPRGRRGPLRRVVEAGLRAAREVLANAIVGLPMAVFVAILLAVLVLSVRAHPAMLDVDPAAVGARHAIRPPVRR
jgi:DNA-binding NtrC family response regulator